MSITAHFINNDWILQHILLDFLEMYDSHTDQNLKYLCWDWKISPSKIKYFLYFLLL